MSEVVANAFNEGHSVKTFEGMSIFEHRADNKAVHTKRLEHRTVSRGVEFNINFNVNEVPFVSRLNEHMQHALEGDAVYEELARVIRQDYLVHKRQYAFYLIDCVNEPLRRRCDDASGLGRMQKELNGKYGDQIHVGVMV